MPNAVFYRGTHFVKCDSVPTNPDLYARIPHIEPHCIINGVLSREPIQGFIETFKLHETSRGLNCDYYLYMSANYMEGPEWFQEMIK